MRTLPPGRKPIQCRWIFKIKLGSDGSVERYKARLVAKGFQQKYGIDYLETFSPTARLSSIRLFLSFALTLGLEVDHVDIKTAYLYSPVEDGVEIWMNQPRGYERGNPKEQFCKLLKTLYGLKQSGRRWNQFINEELQKMNFIRCNSDPCIYRRKEEDGSITMILLYVDDNLIAGKRCHIKKVKEDLFKVFDCRDLGRVKFMVGIKVDYDAEAGVMFLSQKALINKVIERFSIEEGRSLSTPMDPAQKIAMEEANDDEPTINVPFRELTGVLLYLAECTRPDLSFAVHFCARFSSNPKVIHWKALRKIARFAAQTSEQGLQFTRGSDLRFYGYSDSSWADDGNNRRSTGGHVVIFSGGPVSWTSKKQSVVALSTMEAEYISLGRLCQEAVWLIRAMDEFGVSNIEFKMYSDNKAAVQVAKYPSSQHSRSKHIDVKYHFIREILDQEGVSLEWIPSDSMVADIFTKPLGRIFFKKFSSKILKTTNEAGVEGDC